MDHPVGNGFGRASVLTWLAAVGAALVLGGCSRASAPPPASDSVAPPTPTVAKAEVEPHAPVASADAAPGVEPPLASAPVASSPAPVVSSRTAEDCSRFESSPEYRDLSVEDRERALATCRAKEEFRAFVAARQSCTSANQCAVVVGSCPFGCFIPVAKVSVSEISAKLDALGARLDKAGNRCVYRCLSPPSAACVDGRCSTTPP